MTGNPAKKNEAAMEFVDDALTDPLTVRNDLSKGGVEFRQSDQRGLRFDEHGTFVNFLDPTKPQPTTPRFLHSHTESPAKAGLRFINKTGVTQYAPM